MEETILHDMLAQPTPTLSHMRERGSHPPRVTFLDLPKHVRDQIYQEAGYGGNKFIDLNLWSINGLNKRWKDNKLSFPAALLSAGSHQIHDEVETKLYAENTFAVSLIGDLGLQPLEGLSDTALRELRTLIVSICPCRCSSWPNQRVRHAGLFDRHRWDLRSFWYHVNDQLGPCDFHSRQLTSISLTDKSILAQWKRICARLAANSRPHQLSLSLVADVADMKTAKYILDPLSGMPPLRDVAINLGHCLKGIKDIDSRSFIRNAARGLLGENIQKSPFRFMSLPLELQIQILQQTSLVAGENVHFRRNGASRSGDFEKACSNKQFDFKDGEDILSQPMVSGTSFCSREYPDAFSQHCECSSLSPDVYFKVSKDFAYIARHVYYSSNKLCFHPVRSNGWHRVRDRLTLPPFLRRIPLESLWSLRNLCVIFPSCSPDYLLPNHPDWDAWVESIQRLSHLADLSRLKLEVHFVPSVNGILFDYYSEDRIRSTVYHRGGWGRYDMNMEKPMFKTYKRILEPLKKLGCKLLSLQVYISWSILVTGDKKREEYELHLEKMIMGGEYDSVKWGKRDRSEFFFKRQ